MAGGNSAAAGQRGSLWRPWDKPRPRRDVWRETERGSGGDGRVARATEGVEQACDRRGIGDDRADGHATSAAGASFDVHVERTGARGSPNPHGKAARRARRQEVAANARWRECSAPPAPPRPSPQAPRSPPRSPLGRAPRRPSRPACASTASVALARWAKRWRKGAKLPLRSRLSSRTPRSCNPQAIRADAARRSLARCGAAPAPRAAAAQNIAPGWIAMPRRSNARHVFNRIRHSLLLRWLGVWGNSPIRTWSLGQPHVHSRR